MRVLVIGAGGVGASVAAIASRRDFFESMLLADIDRGRPDAVVARLADPRFSAARLDASDPLRVAELCRAHRITHVVNAVDPRHVMTIFAGAFRAGAHYIDLALSRSGATVSGAAVDSSLLPGHEQFAEDDRWVHHGRLALVGMGARPGLVDVFARYAADELFDHIDHVGVRAGSNLKHGFAFAPSFSTWTTIDECLNPPLSWDRTGGFRAAEPFSDPEVFEFPAGIGRVECVAVEHAEVVLIPRAVAAERVSFKIGLDPQFIDVLRTLRNLGLDRTDPVEVNGVRVSPRDVVAACVPDPVDLARSMTGRICVGALVTGTGRDGQPLEVYVHHVADNEWTMSEYGTPAVVWQAAISPVVSLELLATRAWSAAGVLGPESFPAQPFLDLLRDGYGQRWIVEPRQHAG